MVSLQYVNILAGLGTPNLDAVLHMWSHKGQRGRVIFLDLLAALGLTQLRVAVVGPVCCKGTLLSHVQLGVSQNPTSFSVGLLPRQPVPSIHDFMGWFFLQMQNLTLALFGLHEVPISPFLQRVQVL